MLRLLGKFKRNLIKEGKLQQFFIYTIGEVFLVVIGILIALQIDNLNSENKERKIEKELLSSIKNDLRLDIKSLDSLTLIAERGMKFGDSIYYVLNQKEPKAFDLFRYLGPFTRSLYFTTLSSTFDQSTSTGSIKSIKSTSIRNALFQYYSQIKANSSDKSSLHTYQEIFGKKITNIILPTREFAQANGGYLGLPSLSKSKLPPIDVKSLVENKDFNVAILIKTTDYSFQINNWNRYKSKAEDVIVLIEQQLEKL